MVVIHEFEDCVPVSHELGRAQRAVEFCVSSEVVSRTAHTLNGHAVVEEAFDHSEPYEVTERIEPPDACAAARALD